jgi:phosphopantothenoylcysteine decarboxylase/phosphopantothenate--cysteine ligase
MDARLSNKRILLGVSGGIAAYKACDLVRRLRETGVEVRVVMTEAAAAFVTPLSFQALSGHPVHRDFLDADAEAGMGHIRLARWPDAILIAPATADTLARLALGRADDLLATLCLASTAPLALAPAMNHAMWLHPATQANRETLVSRGAHIWGPAEGGLACGETGAGRMLEPAALAARLAGLFAPGTLAGVTVLITAGPTREALDPVRFLSNRSSGRMGYAVAAAAAEAGARVILVSGPAALDAPPKVMRPWKACSRC